MQDNKIALITGATSGIGAAFAKKFASQGYDLIITGRRKKQIQTLANELKETHRVKIEVIIAELANDNDLEILAKKIESNENLEMLVNNAGFGMREYFWEENFTTWEEMLKVHTLATMKLSYAALQKMIANKRGTIINVSSITAYGPYTLFPKNTMYSSTKSFMNMFTEYLRLELRYKGIKGIRLQTLCPGWTVTDFFVKLGFDPKQHYRRKGLWTPMQPEEVVERSLKCLEKNKAICIPGFSNKLLVIFNSLKKFLFIL